jgi:hypothetical protein
MTGFISVLEMGYDLSLNLRQWKSFKSIVLGHDEARNDFHPLSAV